VEQIEEQVNDICTESNNRYTQMAKRSFKLTNLYSGLRLRNTKISELKTLPANIFSLQSRV